MPGTTLLILCALGALAWLLAGGWPYARGTYVADDGPLGLGAGITATCPGCAADADVASTHPVAATVRAGAVRRTDPRAADTGVPGLRPLAVGRDASLHLECPRCRTTYAVVAASRPRVVPTPRSPLD